MLDSLVRVSRRVLRVPETESSQTETRTVRDCTAATKQQRRVGVRTRAGRRRRRLACVGPDARWARARFALKRIQCQYRPNAGRPPIRFDGDARATPPDSRTALRPTSNGSRCITKREVHAVDGRRRTRPVRTATRERPVRIEARARTPPK